MARKKQHHKQSHGHYFKNMDFLKEIKDDKFISWKNQQTDAVSGSWKASVDMINLGKCNKVSFTELYEGLGNSFRSLNFPHQHQM